MRSWGDHGPRVRIVLTSRATSASVRRECAEGRGERLRRGAYALGSGGPPWEPGTAGEREQRALATMRAVAAQLRTDFWFSRESAALVWGLPLITVPRRVHLIQGHRPGRETDPMLARHVGALSETERAERAGLPVTSLERTAVDCGCLLPGAEALAVVDAALRGGAEQDALVAGLRERAGARGVVQGRRVVAAASPGAESPGESLTRWALLEHGVPTPLVQCPVATRLGTYRADLGWPELKVALEFDGAVKYSGRYGDGTDALLAEKRRQDAMEEAGWIVARVTWSDLREPERVAARVVAAHRRAVRRA